MLSFLNIALGFCLGSTVGSVVLVSSMKELRKRYERSLDAALKVGEFTLLGKGGERASGAHLFGYLEAAVRQGDAPRRALLVAGVAAIALIAAAGTYFKFSH